MGISLYFCGMKNKENQPMYICETCKTTYCSECAKKKPENNGSKEIGKWLLDISKYMLTAIFLTSIFTDTGGRWTAVIGVAITVATFLMGWYLVRRK